MPENNNGRVVLVAMDSTEKSKNAFEWYIKNLRQAYDKVVIVTVAIQSVIMSPMFYFSSLNYEISEPQLEEKLIQLAKMLKFHKIAGSVKSVHAAQPGEGIINMAAEVCADMIVIGSQGHNNLRKALFGSVSDYVVHNSDVPVIVCRYAKSA